MSRAHVRTLAFLALACLLVGCGEEPDLTPLGAQPFKVLTYRGGRSIRERLVTPPSREHELLAAWAARHKTGWRRAYVTYAPGTLVMGSTFSLNIHTSQVILNTGGKQYAHDTSASDFIFLSQ